MFLIFFVSLLITSEIDSLNTLIVKDSTKIDSIVNINQIQNDSIFFKKSMIPYKSMETFQLYQNQMIYFMNS